MSPIPEVQQRRGAHTGKDEISDAGRGRLRGIGQTFATAIKTIPKSSPLPPIAEEAFGMVTLLRPR
jgi:hypothetical protein